MTLAIIFDSVGVGEWFVLLAVVLVVVGPKRLPSTARKLGQYYSKFRRAADGFKRQLLEMDTEINQAVAQAEKEAEDSFKDITDEFPADDIHHDDGPDDSYMEGGPESDYYGREFYGRGEESTEPSAPETSSSGKSAPVETAATAPAEPAKPKKRSFEPTITVSPAPAEKV